jgi:hypothetical protein
MCIKMLKFVFYVCMYMMYDVYFPISSLHKDESIVKLTKFPACLH